MVEAILPYLGEHFRHPSGSRVYGERVREGGESASSVFLAMGLTAEDALGAVRLSLGRGTTEEDIRTTADSIGLAWQQLSG